MLKTTNIVSRFFIKSQQNQKGEQRHTQLKKKKNAHTQQNIRRK